MSMLKHILEFNMASSVQGWRKKWFYIKDQKNSSFDQYGIAPFDANKDLMKLSSWDSPPTEAEMEDIKPLLARIQALKSASGGALSGTQLMAFFLQRRIQPLQHRVSKLWSYSGSEDSSQVSEEDIDKKDLDKHVRALTTLTKDDEIPTLAADFIDSEHPLPMVCALSSYLFVFLYFGTVFMIVLRLILVQGHQFFVSRPSLLEGGPIQADPISAASEAPEANRSQDEDDAEVSLEEDSSNTLPPPAHSEEPSLDKKRKRVKELFSLSTSAPKNAVREPSAPNSRDAEIFNLLDS
jgi:hypothetical protein